MCYWYMRFNFNEVNVELELNCIIDNNVNRFNSAL